MWLEVEIVLHLFMRILAKKSDSVMRTPVLLCFDTSLKPQMCGDDLFHQIIENEIDQHVRTCGFLYGCRIE